MTLGPRGVGPFVVRVLLVCGSLQRRSANRAALDVVRAIALEHSAIVEEFEALADIPAFDFTRQDEPIAAVAEWRRRVAEADVVVLAAPEYAGGLAGAAKNALDWLVGSGDLYRKPVAVVSAGTSGGVHGANGREAGVHVDPTDDVEQQLCEIWQRVLDLDDPPSTDREFLELGDSLNATELLVEVEEAFDRRLPATVFLTGATVQTMAAALRGSTTSRLGASVFPLQVGGTRPPLFCLLRWGAVITVRHLVAAVGSDQPVYALWYPAMHDPDEEEEQPQHRPDDVAEMDVGENHGWDPS